MNLNNFNYEIYEHVRNSKSVIKKLAKHPFIIHAALGGVKCKGLFPTHTHGLNKKGWPEFLIDPLCFNPKFFGCVLINFAYDYFKKPRRKKLLDKILMGKTFELPIDKLMKIKEWETLGYTICFRLVSNSFEAVKMAYGPNGNGINRDLVVVQIYMKGDDFALTDEYYKDGVSW